MKEILYGSGEAQGKSGCGLNQCTHGGCTTMTPPPTKCCEKCLMKVSDGACMVYDCPCHSTPDVSWEKRFDDTFELDSYGKSTAIQDKVKQFIRSELASQKARMLEKLPRTNNAPFVGHQCQCGNDIICTSRNTALAEAREVIEKTL